MDAVDTWMRTYPDSPVVLDVLGVSDPAAVRQLAFDLDPDAAEIFSFRVSVGGLFGLRRRDGTRVALKVHRLFRDEAYLDELQRLQGALAAAGFPAPRPLGRRGFAVFEEWLDAGEFRDACEPEVRRAMAATLARFVEAASATGFRPHRPYRALGEEALWPVPHNALLDFEATAAGAEWIDEIARAAKPLRDAPGREVVGHADWAAHHVRFASDLTPLAVYDWDSVTVDTETSFVGTAAATFTYTEELGTPVVWPSLDEALAFVDDYEAARGSPFTATERAAIGGTAVYIRAYGARCGHALGEDGPGSLDEFADALL